MFDIRDKGKEQYQYEIEFRKKEKMTQNSNTAKYSLVRTTESSSKDNIPQNNGVVKTTWGRTFFGTILLMTK